MIELTLQTQPTPITCVQTCIAMALGEPVERVIQIFGPEAMDQRSLLDALYRCGILHNQFLFGTMVASGWYFAVVPSLNHPGGNHQVLFRWNCDNGEWLVLDPAMGRKYKSNGSQNLSWSELVLFHPGGKLPRSNS